MGLTDVMLFDNGAFDRQQLPLALLDRKLPDVANVSAARRILQRTWKSKARDQRVAERSVQRPVNGGLLGVPDTETKQLEQSRLEARAKSTDGATVDCRSSA